MLLRKPDRVTFLWLFMHIPYFERTGSKTQTLSHWIATQETRASGVELVRQPMNMEQLCTNRAIDVITITELLLDLI